MTISDPSATFFGKQVQQYESNSMPEVGGELVYRLALEYDDDQSMPELIEEFFAKIDKSRLDALVIGLWGEAYESSAESLLETLIAHAPELPNLRALFVGDITFEECEISWITQADYTALLNAMPQLQVLKIRGSQQLAFSPLQHGGLTQLIIECGGLPSGIAGALAASSLPALTHLELWLGTEDYGFDGDVALYQRMLAGLQAPNLRYLGLRDAQLADEVAVWLANEPRIASLETLDLSLGVIGDIGAEALFQSSHVRQLDLLDLSHHYISEAWQQKLRTLSLEVVLDDPQEEDEDYEGRYVAVGE